MAGRKKKPDALKIVQGTLRKDRENTLQPRPKPGIPTPASGVLDAKERKQFERITKILDGMNVLAESDVIAVEIMAQSLADYYEVLTDYKDQPRIISHTDRNGNPVVKKNPTVTIMADAHKRVMQLLGRFGLEPASRANLNILNEGDSEDDNPYARLYPHRKD